MLKTYRKRFIQLNMLLVGIVLLLTLTLLGIYLYHNAYSELRMTMEAVVTKLMWIMGQTRDPDRVRELFYTPVQNDLVQ